MLCQKNYTIYCPILKVKYFNWTQSCLQTHVSFEIANGPILEKILVPMMNNDYTSSYLSFEKLLDFLFFTRLLIG